MAMQGFSRFDGRDDCLTIAAQPDPMYSRSGEVVEIDIRARVQLVPKAVRVLFIILQIGFYRVFATLLTPVRKQLNEFIQAFLAV